MSEDRAEDLVGVEARADRLPEVAESFELFDLARQLLAPDLQGLPEVHLAYGDGGLGGKCGEHVDLSKAERCHPSAPHHEYADGLVVEQERHAEDRAQTGQPLELEARVVGVDGHVVDLLHLLGEPDPADQRLAVARHRVALHELDGLG